MYKMGSINLVTRALSLVLILVLSLTSIGLGINDKQGFFSNWSDLFGRGTNYSNIASIGSNAVRINSVDLKKLEPLGKDLFTIKEIIAGKNSHVSSFLYLVLPVRAVKLIKEGKPLNSSDYQITEFLSGFPSQPEIWFRSIRIQEELTLYNSTHAKQIIGVIPEVNIDGKTDLECMNFESSNYPNAETWLTGDMHNFVNLRLGFKDSKWLVAGTSTGAWCAALFAIAHPELYLGALSVAGYYRPALPDKDLLSLKEAMSIKYDLAQLEKKLLMPVPLYIVASLGDSYSIAETKHYLAKPHPNLEIQYQEISSGGHNARVWKLGILPGLLWFSSRF
jgi:hypothetical protein